MTHQPHSFRLTFGAYAAEILAAGATLARLTHAGRDLILPAGSAHTPAFPGALLTPWPNRTVDGRYSFGGEVRELTINEPERNHALHGLAYALNFTPTTAPQASRLELAATLNPAPGYPWQLRFTAHFSLDAHGLHYGVTAENLSDRAAPYGASTHPYLVAGAGSINEWELELATSARLEVTPDRLIPTHLAPAGDFTGALGDARLDHAFTGLTWTTVDPGAGHSAAAAASADINTQVSTGSAADTGTPQDATTISALTSVTLRAPGGTGVAMSWGPECPWVQLFTCDLGDGVPGNRTAVAIEPMTCAPDALNDAAYPHDTGLITLEAGKSHTTSWNLAALEATRA